MQYRCTNKEGPDPLKGSGPYLIPEVVDSVQDRISLIARLALQLCPASFFFRKGATAGRALEKTLRRIRRVLNGDIPGKHTG